MAAQDAQLEQLPLLSQELPPELPLELEPPEQPKTWASALQSFAQALQATQVPSSSNSAMALGDAFAAQSVRQDGSEPQPTAQLASAKHSLDWLHCSNASLHASWVAQVAQLAHEPLLSQSVGGGGCCPQLHSPAHSWVQVSQKTHVVRSLNAAEACAHAEKHAMSFGSQARRQLSTSKQEGLLAHAASSAEHDELSDPSAHAEHPADNGSLLIAVSGGAGGGSLPHATASTTKPKDNAADESAQSLMIDLQRGGSASMWRGSHRANCTARAATGAARPCRKTGPRPRSHAST